jgi:hypothetical protein
LELASGKSSADRVVLTDPSFAPLPPFSGGSVSLTLQAHWQDGVVIPSGKVSCSALVGGARVPDFAGQLSNGSAQCSFRVPPRSPGKQLIAGIEVTDADGNRDSQTAAVKVGDNVAPVTKAIPSQGRYGHTVLLRYRISDDSGQARPVVTVSKGVTRVSTLRGAFAPAQATQSRAIKWQAPPPPKKAVRLAGRTWKFCVSGADRSANRGTASCARLVLR